MPRRAISARSASSGPLALAVVVAELELGRIAVQVALGAMLIDALHAPLEDAEIALDGVGVDLVTRIFPLAVADVIVIFEMPVKVRVLARLIGVDRSFFGDVLFQDRDQRLGSYVVHYHGLGAARGAVHQRQYFVFVCVATPPSWNASA